MRISDWSSDVCSSDLPETGRKSLYVSELHMVGIKGMSDEEAQPLLQFLFRHTTRPEFTCRFRWRKGSLAFWDNRCTMHYAVNDLDGSRRVMHRVTVAGDRPFLGAVLTPGRAPPALRSPPPYVIGDRKKSVTGKSVHVHDIS